MPQPSNFPNREGTTESSLRKYELMRLSDIVIAHELSMCVDWTCFCPSLKPRSHDCPDGCKLQEGQYWHSESPRSIPWNALRSDSLKHFHRVTRSRLPKGTLDYYINVRCFRINENCSSYLGSLQETLPTQSIRSNCGPATKIGRCPLCKYTVVPANDSAPKTSRTQSACIDLR